MIFNGKSLKLFSLLLSVGALALSSSGFAQEDTGPDTSNFADGYSLYERNRDGADFNRFDWPESSYNRGQGSSSRYRSRGYSSQNYQTPYYQGSYRYGKGRYQYGGQYNQSQYPYYRNQNQNYNQSNQHIYSSWPGHGEYNPNDDELPY